MRKGLYTAVAGARPTGTTALLEDIAVPVEELLKVCEGLTALFAQRGYEGCVVFGHAKDGNVHFLINERFDDPVALRRYEAFTEDLVALVLAHGGTLKAEHGTGRIMAPFVRRQYGDALTDMMWEIKGLLDPDGILNPRRRAVGRRDLVSRRPQARADRRERSRPLRRVRLLRADLPPARM